MKLTDEKRAAIKAANPDAILVRSPSAKDRDFVFRAAKLSEFDALLSAINGGDPTEKIYAYRTFARDLVLFPPLEAWNAFAAEMPGVAHSIGNDLAARAGLNADVLVDAL